ncbi:hypothetical protein M404DRAFT_23708 [Pisolithus tinctorius Marx 270]|uniref:Uncharacterized protein n=1 Tax=Pisolithus tinctorius Marx 270 TaxID=870435 RepID=A0A0C3PG02_PISTI|nr:hypothetical protein M404DRAFT_23708 [Pisolithus tinctorius Marx 270]
MSSQQQSRTPQQTPGHSHNYSQVVDESLVILTNDLTNTEMEKTTEKACQWEEAEWREREHKVECKAKWEEAKQCKVEEAWLEAEWRQQEEESQRKKVAEEEEVQKKQVVNMKKRPQGKGKVRAMEMDEADDEWEAGGEEDEPAIPHEGPSGAEVPMWWVEWEWKKLQAMERQAEVHEIPALAFERMGEAAEQMADATEQIAKEWGLYHTWVEWAEMRRREDACEARVAKFECTGGGWKRSQLEVAEEKYEEVDEGAEGDNKEEEEVREVQGGREGQEGGREQVMEE